MEADVTQEKSAMYSPTPCPFASHVDGAVHSLFEKLRHMHYRGVSEFVIVTHRNPDPDALAGALGMTQLLKDVLPGPARVRVMHDGDVRSTLHQLSALELEPIERLVPLLEAERDGKKIGIVLVDQPELRSSWVLPYGMMSHPLIAHRAADAVIDHHGQARLGDGYVVYPEARSTSALIARAREIAVMGRYSASATMSRDESARLSLFLNMGARTDAGVSPLGDLPHTASPALVWVDAVTRPAVDKEKLCEFDVLRSYEGTQALLAARASTEILCSVELEDGPASIWVAYAGIAKGSHAIGACAHEIFESIKQRRAADERGCVVAVVFGVIAPPVAGDSSPGELHGGEIVHISVRAEGPICAQKIAKALSSNGGGGNVAAAAQVYISSRIPQIEESHFVQLTMRTIEATLHKLEQQ